MSLIATAGDNCIWRTDFTSPATVAAGGGTVTGVVAINKKISVATNNGGFISYAKPFAYKKAITNLSVNIKFRAPTDVTNATYLFQYYGATIIDLQIIVLSGKIYVYHTASIVAYAGTIAGDTNYDVDVVYNGAGATNADKLKIYINGAVQTCVFSGTFPTYIENHFGIVYLLGSAGSASCRAGAVVYSCAVNSASLNAEEVKDLGEQDTIPELDRPLIDLPLRSSFYKANGTALGTDMDMETAGVANWIIYSTGVVTKETGTPYQGTQCLRLTSPGTGLTACRQTIFTPGKRFKVTGRVRSNGTQTVTVGTVNETFFTSTASTDWQEVNIPDALPTHAYLFFAITGSPAAGQYVEMDDFRVELQEAYTENKGSLKGTAKLGDGTTTTTFPTLLSPHGMSFDGGDYLKTNYNYTAYNQPFTFACLIKIGVLSGTQFLYNNYDGVNGGIYLSLPASGLLTALVIKGPSAYIGRSTATALTAGKLYFVASTYDGSAVNGGVKIYIDEANVDNADAFTGVFGAFTSGGNLGFSDAYLANKLSAGTKLYKPKFYLNTLTPMQLRILRTKLLKEQNI